MTLTKIELADSLIENIIYKHDAKKLVESFFEEIDWL